MGKDKLSREDRALFRQAVEGTRRLRHDKLKPAATPAKPIPQQRQRDEQAVLDSLLQDPPEDEQISGEEVLYVSEGVAGSVLRKLRRGQLRIEAELDLHRHTRDQARLALAGFLSESLRLSYRCVRIIHGKGHGSFNKQPVLKGSVKHWLQQRREVLAFCSARPADGGSGAVYVLLRRSR